MMVIGFTRDDFLARNTCGLFFGFDGFRENVRDTTKGRKEWFPSAPW